MSAARENIIKTLEQQIRASEQHTKELRDAFEAIRKLPNSVFEALYGTLSTHDIGKYNIAAPLSGNGNSNGKPKVEEEDLDNASEFSGNRQIVLTIIKTENRAIAKKEIVRKFKQLTGRSEKDAKDSVTYALTGLKNNAAIKSFNPSASKNVKVGYWTLPSWWDGNALIEEYKPLASSTSKMFAA